MLQLDHVSFAYDDTPVLEDINLKVHRGEHVSIIGESGCGKSTLLKIIYGLLHVEVGEVYWDGNPVLGPNDQLIPGGSHIKYLSQDFDLMPHTTVFENISQFLSVFEPEELRRRTTELLEIIEMTDFADTKIKYLSGGQQQRVALARVLAQPAEVLMLDEPFSHIDNSKKNTLRRKLFSYVKRKKITVLTATHDPDDMLPYADRVFVIRDKKIIAKDTSKGLFDNPKDMYVASLFGEANKIPINVVKSYADTKRRIIVYAHEFGVSQKSGLEVIVKESFYMGSHFMIDGTHEGESVFFHHHKALEKGEKVFLNVSIETINKRLSIK